MKKSILFVDDSRQVLDALARMLQTKRDIWSMTFVDDPLEAWEILRSTSFDAITLDVNMPVLSGLELLDRIRQTETSRDVPVVMLTGLGDRHLKRQALDLGAADLLNKPVEAEDLIARLQNVLRLKEYEDLLKHENSWLERKIQERTVELYRSRQEVVWRLGKAAEHRDNDTGNHVIRVGCMCRVIAEALDLDSEFVETLFAAAPLHDIGKIGIPDAILMKQGPLSEAERQIMMRHCRIGERILTENAAALRLFDGDGAVPEIRSAVSSRNPLIDMAARIALSHHEKWDGTGYPQSLSGDAIPIEARITAIADVFDALMSARPYKVAFDEQRSMAIVSDSVGTHFDPTVYEAFLKALPRVRRIREQLRDCPRYSPHEDHCDAPDPVCR